MNAKLRHNIWLKIIMVLIPLILIIIFVIYPAAKEILDINKEITKERENLEQKLARGLSIADIKKDLIDIQASIGQLDDVLIKKDQELSFINNLESLADKNGVKIDISSDFTGPKINDEIKQTTLQANVSGNYYQLINFLRDLEKMPQYYNLNIIITSTKLKMGNYPMTIQLMGQVYIQQ